MEIFLGNFDFIQFRVIYIFLILRMKKNSAFFLIICWCALAIPAEGDRCVWYGECGTVNGMKQNCPTNETAQPINDAKAEATLRKRCGHFFVGTGKSFLYA